MKTYQAVDGVAVAVRVADVAVAAVAAQHCWAPSVLRCQS